MPSASTPFARCSRSSRKPTRPGCNTCGRSRAARLTSRKLIYVRKVAVDGETLVVGSDFFLATPIWMKVEDSRAWLRNPPG